MKNKYNVGILYKFKYDKKFSRRTESSIKGILFF